MVQYLVFYGEFALRASDGWEPLPAGRVVTKRTVQVRSSDFLQAVVSLEKVKISQPRAIIQQKLVF